MIVLKPLWHCSSIMRVMYMKYCLSGAYFWQHSVEHLKKTWDNKFINIITLNFGKNNTHTCAQKNCTNIQVKQTWCSNILTHENYESIIFKLCCFPPTWALVLMVEEVFLKQWCYLLNTGIKKFSFFTWQYFQWIFKQMNQHSILFPLFPRADWFHQMPYVNWSAKTRI